MNERNTTANNHNHNNNKADKNNNSSDKNKKLFPQKLWELIHDPRHQHCLRWSQDGQRVYLNRDLFETNYLKNSCNQFHTQKAISFVRQMNMYGFRKVDDCYYENDNFKRGCHHLLKNMVRRHSNKGVFGVEGYIINASPHQAALVADSLRHGKSLKASPSSPPPPPPPLPLSSSSQAQTIQPILPTLPLLTPNLVASHQNQRLEQTSSSASSTSAVCSYENLSLAHVANNLNDFSLISNNSNNPLNIANISNSSGFDQLVLMYLKILIDRMSNTICTK